MSPDPQQAVPARKRWGLVALLAGIAALFPLITAGTEAGLASWAWVIFVGFLAVLAGARPDIFHGPPTQQSATNNDDHDAAVAGGAAVESAGRAVTQTPYLWLAFKAQSLYHGPILADFRCVGTEARLVTLDDHLTIGAVVESVRSLVVTPRQVQLSPTNSESARMVALIHGPVEPKYGDLGVTDSEWFYYPLMTGHMNLQVTLPVNTGAYVSFGFPKSIHYLPKRTSLRVNNCLVNVRDDYIGYPDTKMACGSWVQPSAQAPVISFKSEYRESAMVLGITMSMPFIVNLIVPLVLCSGDSTIAAVRVPVAVAIIPLSFNLWNWSNVLKAAPALTNFLSMLMLVLVAFNALFVGAWTQGSMVSWMRPLQLCYYATTGLVVLSTALFLLFGVRAKWTPLGLAVWPVIGLRKLAKL